VPALLTSHPAPRIVVQAWARPRGVGAIVALVAGLALFTACCPPTPARVDRGAVLVNGSTLYYESAGRGPVVVLLHAGNLDRRVWDPQFLPLAREHRVIRYDLRGYGRSGPADAPFQHHEDLRALLDTLGVARASLVGLSGGGRIAIDFALTHPERVDRLVLASPGLSGWVYADASDTAYFAEARRARDRGDAAALGLAWLGSAYTRPAMARPELVGPLREMAAANGKVWMARLQHGDLERVADPPALHRTAELRVPTLVVVGARDTPDIRAIADTLAATVPGVRLARIENAGHLVNMEAPQRFTALVRAFLRR
jgi:pimeloyl-ACP methyl ester carboxylesterase